MLTKIGQLVVDSGLVRELSTGTSLYRVRPHPADIAYTTADELGTPPREAAFSNRMSPAGIPHFYGAFEPETAIAEVWPQPSAGKEAATVARFSNSAAFSVIDLAALPEIPSIFDDEQREVRAPLRFLHEFAGVISEPVTSERSDREVVAYVPTQILSRFGGTATILSGRTTFQRFCGDAVRGALTFRRFAMGSTPRPSCVVPRALRSRRRLRRRVW